MNRDGKESRTTRAVGSLLSTLQERAKELACLYALEEVLRDPRRPLSDVFEEAVEIIPPGWQYPDSCEARISHMDTVHQTDRFEETPWCQHADIVSGDNVIGKVTVTYLKERPEADDGPFLKEETKLIRTIAERLGHFALHQRTSQMFETMRGAGNGTPRSREWRIALDLILKTDQALFSRISRKMMNHLCWRGVDEAKILLQRYGEDQAEEAIIGEVNQPGRKADLKDLLDLAEETFEVASQYLSDNEIIEAVHRWIQEDKSGFLVRTLVNGQASLTTICDALKRYQHLIPEGVELSHSGTASVRVSLIRRFFTEQLEFINIAKNHVDVPDFFDLVGRIVSPARSHGKLGGKSAGLFLAERALAKYTRTVPEIGEILTPRTWYVTSDGLLEFLRYNNIEDVYEQKYKGIDEVRQEYPHITQVFKNSHFPQEMVRGLSMALDELGERPLIVRSSSLLEDRLGSAFSGKYKSLFLANRGDKQTRLDALMDAIAEVYASTFGPDPIEYRAERGLLDFNEEMGIMIQEVVGQRVGDYFMPSFAGVAFSRNEFRWSPRIRREDGLVRIVPGLGTRAVDRLTDDYPILAAPGQPKMRVNVSSDETVRYSPKKLDVINLSANGFKTLDFTALAREHGSDIPGIERIVSVWSDGRLKPPLPLATDYGEEDIVVTFEGLFTRTPFLERMRAVLTTLEEALGTPVDIEFASDGENLYLLQCRPQSFAKTSEAAQIPKYIPPENLVFSAKKYISNGRMPDITHVVYVSPAAYGELEDHDRLVEVGHAVGRLNKLLPKRQFILMGPGRWGSRGDIKLGVRVTYSDINNSALLVEIARMKGNYVPDLSFGTHFFQDLVESRIRYLPLYPDDDGVRFNERFLSGAPNLLPTMLPDSAHLAGALRVIDVPAATEGRILRVLQNADLDEVLAYLAPPDEEGAQPGAVHEQPERHPVEFWQWRLRMAERIAADLDPARFGVVAIYLFGSTKNATAGPASDIDLLIHFRGSDEQRTDLASWLEGWGRALSEMNYLRTGYRTANLLDPHIVTDNDITNKTSYAVKIGAVTDPARELPMGGS